MKDLTKVFIDLSKLSEEERNKIEKVTGFSLIANDYPYLIWLNGRWDQGVRYHIKNRTELTYPEFIKLFEGGEGSAIKMTFGITDKNMEVINKQISRFEGAEFDRLSWEKIAKEIGWDLPTIILWYFRKKESKSKWIKIESEADLPKVNAEYYWTVTENDKNIKERWFNKFFNQYEGEGKVTHYQPIVKPLPPKF